MAVRRRRLYPDQVLATETYGEVACVSDEALIEAAVQGAQTVALAGGVLTIIVDRHPTDLPQEMVTVGGVMEWKDRTDARPQAERSVEVQQPAPEPEPAPEQPELPEVEQVVVGPSEDNPDGLDPATLEEEDLSSIPVQAR